jgi:8-oxo-dGTP pyrophosphatase MutT (NUDIX family)
MKEEMVDVLNLDGEVIGIATRQEMRAKRLPHRCVYILVFNGRGEIFIHLRTPTKDVFPSHWDLCAGGVVAAGENFDLGAIREGFEELGVKVKPEYLFPFRYEDAHTVVFAKVYRCIHDGPFILQKEEVVRGEFVKLMDLENLISRENFCPDGLKVLREAKAMGFI